MITEILMNIIFTLIAIILTGVVIAVIVGLIDN
jgi:hypothetical protein